MKIYFYIACLLVTLVSCNKPTKEFTSINPKINFTRHEVNDPYSLKPVYSISYPNEWEFHILSDSNDIYITDSNGMAVEREIISKVYAYSKDKPTLLELNFNNISSEKIFSMEEIIQNELVPKFKMEGFERVKTYPLGLIKNKSLYFHNSTYRFPEQIKSYATEWTNEKGEMKLCIIEYLKDADSYTINGTVSRFEYTSEILTMKKDYFDHFKKAYFKSLESIIWNKAYLEEIFNQSYTASITRDNQMVVRKEPLLSYLRSIDFHNLMQHSIWKEDKVCMGIDLPDKSLDYYYSDYGYSDSSNLYDASISGQDTSWNEINY